MITMLSAFDSHVEQVVRLAERIEGHLTPKEVRFLCLLAAVPTTPGEVLEVGSFKGKSTVVLAESVRFAGGDRVVAVDPLCLPAATDPKTPDTGALPDEFRKNLRTYGVDSIVEFHQTFSRDLGRLWDRKLRLLWIDGDHSYVGAKTDFETFFPFLSPGAIVAFHDVLHSYEGPVRVLCEGVLLSDQFGACGICGSIGWSQYIGDRQGTKPHWNRKRRLYQQLSRLIPHLALQEQAKGFDRLAYRLKRALVPHGEVRPDQWINEIQILNGHR